MDVEVNESKPKQERLRTRWTASLDKIFADLVVEQIQARNNPNNFFDKKTWNYIRDQFNRQTDLSFNNNQLRKHLDVLRTRYQHLKSAFDQNDFALDDSCCIGFDLWEDMGAQPKPEMTKINDCPIYEQLCTIFADSSTDGKYAQSSHYEDLNKATKTNPAVRNLCPETHPETPTMVQGNSSLTPKLSENVAEKKRKRQSEIGSSSAQNGRDQELNGAMAGALMDMIAASKIRLAAMSRVDERFTISTCIKALDEIGGIEDRVYYAALDLFEDPSMREMFVSLKGNKIRLAWLQGKCGNATS